MLIQENISLKDYNTFGIDVRARKFVKVDDRSKVDLLISQGEFLNNEFLILGGGSNVLFSGNFNGLVVKNDIRGIEFSEQGDDVVIVTAGAGMVWDDLVGICIDQNLGGIENLSLIPGSVGAGPIQNIGAYGVELKDVFLSLEAVDLTNGTIKTFFKDECRFGYRDSIFKQELKGKYMILSVSLKLIRNADPDTSYGAIRDELDKMGVTDTPGIRSVGMAVAAIRERKLPDTALSGNAGSFFKNPLVATKKFEEIRNRYPEIPSYEGGKGMHKLPAAWLIDKCGWKGKRSGNAGVHDNQALVLVNHGGASGREIIELAGAIKSSVHEKFGVYLEMEVNVI